MTSLPKFLERIEINHANTIPGLNYRPFLGEEDYQAMLDIINSGMAFGK